MKIHRLLLPSLLASAACATLVNDKDAQEAQVAKEIGDGFMEEKRPAEALAQYQTALKLTPDRHTLKADIGRAYHAMNRSAEAARWTRKACEKHPEVPECWNDLAYFEFVSGNAKAAIVAARKALAIDTFPEPEKAQSTLAQAYLKLGQVTEAERAVAKAIENKPEECGYRNLRTLVLIRKKEFEEALFEAGWAAKKCPFDARSLAWEAYARYRIGQHRVAREHYQMLIDRFAASPYAEYGQRSLDALAQRRPPPEPAL